jgi:hypothetical protein
MLDKGNVKRWAYGGNPKRWHSGHETERGGKFAADCGKEIGKTAPRALVLPPGAETCDACNQSDGQNSNQ